MEINDTDQLVWTIVNGIYCHDRFFGATLDRWHFMLVPQPKIPFANETAIPKIVFTYNFIDEKTAVYVIKSVFYYLYGSEITLRDSDFGNYLICFYE